MEVCWLPDDASQCLLSWLFSSNESNTRLALLNKVVLTVLQEEQEKAPQRGSTLRWSGARLIEALADSSGGSVGRTDGVRAALLARCVVRAALLVRCVAVLLVFPVLAVR